jgi:aminoglycoside phosphotransferase (APT) family kinase protein
LVHTADHAPTTGGDETSLRLTLERLLARAQRRPVRVTNLRREPSPFATLFPVEILSLSLEGGERVSLFVKRLGSEQADHPEKQRRDREIRIYEELLGQGDLPVVKYYGHTQSRASGQCELFLEYVDDWNLKYQDLQHWFCAARRLGQLHAHFATQAERLLACDFLLRFDANYFREWAARALAVVAAQSAGLAAALSRVVANYDRVACLLGLQPVTLVHNDLAPKNVIADRSTSPSRICFVDWEMAGVGCGLLDLVDLKYGLDPASDEWMCAGYCEAVAGAGLLPSSREALEGLFAACELHKTFYRLAFSQTWGVSTERVAQWVAEAQRLSDRV